MKTKQEIEIEGLPEGFRVVAIDMTEDGTYKRNNDTYCFARVRLEKIKLRRIVLELTEDELSLLRSIPVEQRLLKNPAMLDLIKKIQNLDKVKEM